MSGYPTPLGGWGGVKIPLACVLQVSTYLDSLDVYSTNLNKGNCPLLGPPHAISDPPLEGVKRKSCDCARSLGPIVSRSWGLILGHILDGTASLPCCHNHISHLGRSGHVPHPLGLFCKVCLIQSFGMILMSFACYCEIVRLTPTFPALQGMSLQSYLDLEGIFAFRPP